MASHKNPHPQNSRRSGSGNGKVGGGVGVVLALGTAVAAALGIIGGGDDPTPTPAPSESTQHSAHAAPTCTVDTLPREAHEQIEGILTDAPSDDGPHDGKHFGNYEGILPKENSNYYREYTVKTPGLKHRGARRIVVGGGTTTDPDVWYYSSDHYGSFCEIPDADTVSVN